MIHRSTLAHRLQLRTAPRVLWIAAAVVAACIQHVDAGGPACPAACVFAPGEQPRIDLEWRPAVSSGNVGETVQVGLYAVRGKADILTLMSGVQLVIEWDPATLNLQGVIDNGPYDWVTSSFTNDSALDDLNAGLDVPPIGVPANDGNAAYEALADFPKPVGEGPAVIPAEGLLVASFEFQILQATVGSSITLPSSLGDFSCSTAFSATGPAAGCDIKGLVGGATITTDEVEIEIVSSVPPNNAIDARQPTSLDGTQSFGWNSIQIQFNSAAAGVDEGDLEVTASCGKAPSIASTSVSGTVLTVNFTERIPLAAWTTVRHIPSDTTARIAALPADANGDGTSAGLDILALIDHLNGVEPLPSYGTDIDRSGDSNQLDILRLIDLLNGAGAFDPWNQVSICE